MSDAIKIHARKVSVKPIDSIKESPKNTRRHRDEQINQIADSIRKVGFTAPVLIDDDGVILSGHGRFKAAKTLGMAKIPCVVLSDLSEEEKRAYRIADNKLALNSEWDHGILVEELTALQDLGFDMSATGFNEVELESLLFEPEVEDQDAEEHWEGMPEFKQDDITVHRTIKVHFKSEDDVKNFSELVGVPITDKTGFLWWPLLKEKFSQNSFISDNTDNADNA